MMHGRRTFSMGVVLNVIFQNSSFCTDLFPNTLLMKYIKFAPPPKKKAPESPPPPPFLCPCDVHTTLANCGLFTHYHLVCRPIGYKGNSVSDLAMSY